MSAQFNHLASHNCINLCFMVCSSKLAKGIIFQNLKKNLNGAEVKTIIRLYNSF